MRGNTVVFTVTLSGCLENMFVYTNVLFWTKGTGFNVKLLQFLELKCILCLMVSAEAFFHSGQRDNDASRLLYLPIQRQ